MVPHDWRVVPVGKMNKASSNDGKAFVVASPVDKPAVSDLKAIAGQLWKTQQPGQVKFEDVTINGGPAVIGSMSENGKLGVLGLCSCSSPTTLVLMVGAGAPEHEADLRRIILSYSDK